jgi:hypothetical protein
VDASAVEQLAGEREVLAGVPCVWLDDDRLVWDTQLLGSFAVVDGLAAGRASTVVGRWLR